MVVEVGLGLLACRIAVCATVSYQAQGKRKRKEPKKPQNKQTKSVQKTQEENRNYLCP